MNTNTNRQLLEIDFQELIYKLLSQWKAILIFSIAMALMICGLKYLRDVSAYNAEQESARTAEMQSGLTIEERITGVIDALPGEEREAVDFLVQEKRWIDEQKDYIDNSILMKTNPSNQRVLKLVYEISSEDTSAIQGLLHNYSVYLYSEEVIEAIKPYIAPEVDNKYISELFYDDDIEGEDTATVILDKKAALDINLVLTEEADADGVIEALDNELQSYCSKTQSLYNHKIKKIESEDIHLYHKRNVDNRIGLFNSMNNLQINLKNSEANLSESQTAAWTAIKTMLYEAGDVAETIDDAGTVDKKPGFSKKYALLGFVLGVFLYAFVYVVLLIAGGVTVSATSLKNITGVRLLGEAYYDNNSTGLKRLFHSKLVNKIYGRIPETYDKNIEKMKASIDTVCKHKNIERISYIDVMDKDSKSSRPDVLETITKDNTEKTTSFEINNEGSQFSEEALLQIENAVLVVSNNTKAETLFNIISLCREYDINVLGSMYIAEA